MTWEWTLPHVPSGKGLVGAPRESKSHSSWPRYTAEYLKNALISEQHKYDTEGLQPEEKAVYLDKVTSNYEREADEALKHEFDLWLKGTHTANIESEVYENCDGRPTRRWVARDAESEDVNGGYKVGLPRAGWKHTPWGRASLTHLPGVRGYLREQTEKGWNADLQMQLLAEHGPQNLDEAWMYFKHWVKGRPLSDSVKLQPSYIPMAEGARSDFGMSMPDLFHAYRNDMPDRQPGVLATDENAMTAAVADQDELPKEMLNDAELQNLADMKDLRARMEQQIETLGLTAEDVPPEPEPPESVIDDLLKDMQRKLSLETVQADDNQKAATESTSLIPK